MAYTFSKKLNYGFDETIEKVTEELKKEGFGVLNTIDMSATLKNKLDVDIRPYKILGACNPGFAYKAVQVEDEIGTMLPCNIVVQQTEDNQVKVSAIDPIASMMAVKNENLTSIATEIQLKLKIVIDNL